MRSTTNHRHTRHGKYVYRFISSERVPLCLIVDANGSDSSRSLLDALPPGAEVWVIHTQPLEVAAA